MSEQLNGSEKNLGKAVGVAENLQNHPYGDGKLRYTFKIEGKTEEFSGFYEDGVTNPGFNNGDKICIRYEESHKGDKTYYNLRYLISNLSQYPEERVVTEQAEKVAGCKPSEVLMLAAVTLQVARGKENICEFSDEKIHECYNNLNKYLESKQ